MGPGLDFHGAIDPLEKAGNFGVDLELPFLCTSFSPADDTNDKVCILELGDMRTPPVPLQASLGFEL